MILQSKDKFDELARINEITREVDFMSKRQSPELGSLPIDGSFSIIEGKMCSLYRKRNNLHLIIGEQEFEILEDVKSLIMQEGSYNIFKLISGAKQILNFKYRVPNLETPLALDPTPFVEYEDFDFLYFVHNVLKDNGRRQRIYNQ